MTAPTHLLGMVDDRQYGTIIADIYEHIPALLYPDSVPVYAEMRRDSRLTAVLDGYALQIRRAQWQLDGAGCRPEVTQFVADCLGLNVVGEDKATGARRRGVSWSDHLRAALLSQVWGHYAFEMQAEIDDRGRARLAVLAERIPATIHTIHADPATGELLGVDQLVTARDRSPQIPADRLVFYSRAREGTGWQGTSLIRPAYAPWLLKREMMRVNAISNRRWGAGVPVAEAHPGTNPSPAQMADAQRMVSAARAGDQSGASVPPGFTMRIVGLSGTIPDTLGFIKLLNQEISGSALMPHLDLGTSESGSRALGGAFIDSWTLALESEAEAIADTTTRQACTRIVDWNWGTDEPVPRVVVSGIGSRREVTAESLQLLMSAGALAADPALEAWVRREYRLPERTEPLALPAGPPAKAPAKGEEDEPTEDAPAKVAAAAEQVDYETLRKQHAQATAATARKWQTAAGELVTAVAAATAAEVTGGMLIGLGGIAVPAATTIALADLLAAGMVRLAEQAAKLTTREVRAQAATDPALPDDTRERLRDVALSTVTVLVAGYSSGAARVALAAAGPDTDPETVGERVHRHLTDLSRAKPGGWLTGQIAAAMTTAQAAGRNAVLAQLPPTTRFRASEELDTNSCAACRKVDGRQYRTLLAALADYPAGKYIACEGGDRCRGQLVPEFGG